MVPPQPSRSYIRDRRARKPSPCGGLGKMKCISGPQAEFSASHIQKQQWPALPRTTIRSCLPSLSMSRKQLPHAVFIKKKPHFPTASVTVLGTCRLRGLFPVKAGWEGPAGWQTITSRSNPSAHQNLPTPPTPLWPVNYQSPSPPSITVRHVSTPGHKLARRKKHKPAKDACRINILDTDRSQRPCSVFSPPHAFRHFFRKAVSPPQPGPISQSNSTLPIHCSRWKSQTLANNS